MRATTLLGCTILAALLAFGSGSRDATAAAPAATKPKLDVVAAFYPLAYAAARVGGRLVDVKNLTSPGAEPHDLELTPSQRDAIDDADLILVMGHGFQPSVEAAARTRRDATVQLLDELPIDASGKKVAVEGSGDTRGTLDPHVWLDPTLMAKIVDRVEVALSKASRAHAATFAANAASFEQQLTQLDARFRQGLASCDRRVIVTSHEAFGYLAAEYGLRQESVAGLSPDAEPSAKRLGELADLVRRLGVTTIFTEELVSPRIAKTLAREAGGLRTDVLNPLEGLTPKEATAGDDYVTVMDHNLAKLRVALGCR